MGANDNVKYVTRSPVKKDSQMQGNEVLREVRAPWYTNIHGSTILAAVYTAVYSGIWIWILPAELQHIFPTWYQFAIFAAIVVGIIWLCYGVQLLQMRKNTANHSTY